MNSGTLDANLFASEVRLGRRGAMSKTEAVAEFGKLKSKFVRINCILDNCGSTPKPAETASSVSRVNLPCVCRFTKSSGAQVVERFTLEMEIIKSSNSDQFSGLWTPEKMVQWQSRAR